MDSSYDLDELLSILENTDETEEKIQKPFKDNRRVINFINENNIKVGDIKFPTYVVYYHFAKWCGKFRDGKSEFFRTFSKHFEQKRSKNQRFYLLDESLEFTQEVREKALKFKSKRKTVRGQKQKR